MLDAGVMDHGAKRQIERSDAGALSDERQSGVGYFLAAELEVGKMGEFGELLQPGIAHLFAKRQIERSDARQSGDVGQRRVTDFDASFQVQIDKMKRGDSFGVDRRHRRLILFASCQVQRLQSRPRHGTTSVAEDQVDDFLGDAFEGKRSQPQREILCLDEFGDEFFHARIHFFRNVRVLEEERRDKLEREARRRRENRGE